MIKRLLFAIPLLLLPSLASAQVPWGDFQDGVTFTKTLNTVGQDGEVDSITSEDFVLVKNGATVYTSGITVDDDVSLDFGDGAAAKTGLHKITIDLETVGGGAGEYDLIYKAGTVDSKSVHNRVAATFSVGRYASFDDTLSAPTGPPGATPTYAEALSWLNWLSQAKSTTTGSIRRWFAADESTVIAEEDLSDNGTTMTKGEAGAP